MDVLTGLTLTVCIMALGSCLYFTYESKKEQEDRAVKNGLLLSLFFVLLAFGLFIPVVGTAIKVVFGLVVLFGLSLLIPAKPDQKALRGAKGYLVEKPVRFDERDTVFARFRSLVPGSELYRTYYSDRHPEKEELDAKRREKGFLGKPGGIDSGYLPNVAMMKASFDIPPYLGLYAYNDPETGTSRADLTPEKATDIVKNFAMHIGRTLWASAK